MLSLLGKWIYAQDENAENSPQKCFFAEAEEGEWLLVDVELTEEEVLILKDYVVINEQNVASVITQKKNCGMRPPGGPVNQGNVEKSQKYFHGKMMSRLVPRKMMEPYKIMRPLKWSKPLDEKCSAYKFKKINSWLEILSSNVPRTLGTVESIRAVRVNAKSLKSPDTLGMQMENPEPVLEPVKLQPKQALIENLSTAIVKFEPSPMNKLLWDLQDIKRERSFDFLAKVRSDSCEVPLRTTVTQGNVCDRLSIRKRRKFNPVISTSDLLAVSQVDSEHAHTPKPLLAIEWQPERSNHESSVIQESDRSEDDEGDDKWFMRPALPMFSDLCEKTSQLSAKLGHQIPRAAIFLWAQILQLLSCSKRLLSLKSAVEQVRPNAIIREPPQSRFSRSVSCKDYCEERVRASVEKRTKRHDTKKNLKRTHRALTQKYLNDNNRKRAMDSKRFQGACGRRGC
nr:uncharacterized protein LOC131773365 [Pocillopora verrucosa]